MHIRKVFANCSSYFLMDSCLTTNTNKPTTLRPKTEVISLCYEVIFRFYVQEAPNWAEQISRRSLVSDIRYCMVKIIRVKMCLLPDISTSIPQRLFNCYKNLSKAAAFKQFENANTHFFNPNPFLYHTKNRTWASRREPYLESGGQFDRATDYSETGWLIHDTVLLIDLTQYFRPWILSKSGHYSLGQVMLLRNNVITIYTRLVYTQEIRLMSVFEWLTFR